MFNLNDVISLFAPKWAVKREMSSRAYAALTNEPTRGGSTTMKRLRSWRPKSLSRDKENEGEVASLESPRQRLAARAGWLFRNNSLAKSCVNVISEHAVGLGLQLKSIPDGEFLGWDKNKTLQFAKEVERRFALYANGTECDIRGQSSFDELQIIVLLTLIVKGDIFFSLYRKTKSNTLGIQLFEPERVITPINKISDSSIVGGIKKDGFGKPSLAYVANDFPENGYARDFKEMPFYAKSGRQIFFQVMVREAVEQTRGESKFTPVVDLFADLDRYTAAELTAAVVGACFTVLMQSEDGNQMAPLNFGSEEGQQDVADPTRDISLGEGTVVEVPKNSKFDVINPGRPNAQFDPFVTSILKMISVGFGLPMECVLMYFTSSYSASRAALQSAWKSFRKYRNVVAKQFCKPVFETWFDMEVTEGRIIAPGYFTDPLIRAAYLRVNWIGEQPGSLDPLKEANARKTDLESGVKDLDEACIEATGTGYWEKHDTMVEIHKARDKEGLVTPGDQKAVPSNPTGSPSNGREPKGEAQTSEDEVRISLPAQQVTAITQPVEMNIVLPKPTSKTGTINRNPDGSMSFQIIDLPEAKDGEQ